MSQNQDTRMYSYIEIGEMANLGLHLNDLHFDIADWSQKTFGSDAKRGPVGPLKHLEKEAKEAWQNPKDTEEYADCLILILDAARRASISPLELIRAAMLKMTINKKRKWPKPTTDEPVEHTK